MLQSEGEGGRRGGGEDDSPNQLHKTGYSVFSNHMTLGHRQLNDKQKSY